MSTTTRQAPEWLDGMIADLERSIEVDTTRLDLARQLRATFDTETVPEPAKAEQPKAPKRTKQRHEPPNKGKAYERVSCPVCGDRIAKTQLARHQRAKHAADDQQPIDAPADAAASPTASVEASGRTYYECTTCSAHASTREALARHTDTKHRRGLKAEEHRPVLGTA